MNKTDSDITSFLQGFIGLPSTMLACKDNAGRYRYVNHAFAQLFYLTPDDMLGKIDAELFPAAIVATLSAAEQQVLRSGQVHTSEETYRTNQEDRIVSAERAPIVDEQQQVCGMAICFVEVTDQVKARKELQNAKQVINRLNTEVEQRSLIDIMTGLGNRKLFFLQIDQELSHCRRYQQDLAIVMLQPRNLAMISQAFGLSVKDSVLQDIAEIIKAGIRDTDFAVRWTAECFLWVMPRTGIQEATAVAARIRQNVDDIRVGIRNPNKISVALGVCDYQQGELLDDFLARTDRALRRALDSTSDDIVNFHISVLK